MTRVVDLKREPFDVYIGRPGHGQDGYFGNPFVVVRDGTRQEVIERYLEYFLAKIERDSEFRSRVEDLRGKTLGCFCKPEACHGDVIVAWLDQS